MSEENVEVVRTPMRTTVHLRRRLEERIGLRFPRLLALLARGIWGLPNSRLRRGAVRRFVRVGWEAFNRGDLDAAFMLWHPDCETIFPPGTATIGIGSGTHGRDERVRVQQRVIDDWAEFRFEPEELIDLGDGRLLSIGHMKGTGRSSGVPVDTEWATIFTAPDGRVIHERVFADNGEALEAVGLAE